MTLIAHYPLQEDSGGTAFDVRGGNDGTVNGATQGATGILGASGYSFDGTDDGVNTNWSSFDESGAFTWSAWVYVRSFDPGSFNRGGIVDAQVTSLRAKDPDNFAFTVESDNTRGLADVGGYNTNEWYHVVGVHDGNLGAELYVDGVLATSGSGSGSAQNIANNIYIGINPNQDTPFDGNIADVRIYDHALTAQEVQYLYGVVAGNSRLQTKFKTV